jgi:hypothetical protein
MFDNLGALTSADKSAVFTTVKNGIYLLTVKEVEDGETDDRRWDDALKQYVPTGTKVPQRTIRFTIGNVDGTDSVINTKGEQVTGQTHTVWINPSNLRWNKKEGKPQEGRAVLAALAGVPADGDITEIGKSTGEALIGKQIKAYLRNFINKNGKEKVELIDIESVKKN